MARLPYLEQTDLAPENQDLLKRNITLYKQLAHSPKMLRAFQGVGYNIRFGSSMDTRLRGNPRSSRWAGWHAPATSGRITLRNIATTSA
ncbi:MAG: hypothetical protein QM811_21215 [Pirellulales bacterium]